MSTGQLTRAPDRSARPAAGRAATTRPVRSHKPLASLRFRRIRALVLLLAVVTMIWGCGRLIGWAVSDDGSRGQGGSAQGAPPPSSESASSALADAVAMRTEGIKGDTAVGTLDLTTGVTATYQPDKTFATASIVKVDILAALLLQTDGQLSASQKAIAKRMIENSDNNAATALWKQIGGAAGLTAANQQLGLTATTPGTKARWGLTTTTVNDQLRLLSVVFTDDSPLSAESRLYVRTLMGGVANDQGWGVSAADDGGGPRARLKNGWLPRPNGWIVNSIGSVEHAGHPILIVALSDGRPSENVGIDVLEGIAADAAKVTTGS